MSDPNTVEPGTIIYNKSPNVQVADDEGNLHRANLVAVAPGEIRFNDPDNSPNVEVADEDGVFHRAQLVAMIGGGGGSDPHNLGYYADLTALQTAHPTGEDGDFAILGSTDTIWVWDSGTSAWVDTDKKGQVTSVNNQTGDVTVQETLVSGTNIKTVDGNSLLGSGNLELSTYLTYPAGWTTTGTTKAFCDDIAADTSAVEGKAYLGEVTLSDLPASMANAEIVVEIMSGTTASNKVISLTCKSGNTAPYMWVYTYWDNGTNVSGWQGFATAAQGAKADTAVQPADLATVATSGLYSDLSGTPTIPAAQVNSDWNANSGVAEILNKPTIPDIVQYSTMPTASADNLGDIVQFTGTTDASYTNGYFYKCVSDGQQPATYSWEAVEVQASSGGLPDQTGQSGKFLTTDGTDASWNNSLKENGVITFWKGGIYGDAQLLALGYNISGSATSPNGGVKLSVSNDMLSIRKWGTSDTATLQADIVEPGAGSTKTLGKATNANTSWNNVYTKAINAGSGAADITVPTTGGTMAVIGVNTTATLAVADWSSNTQTVTVSGVKADSVVFVSPAPASASDYASAGILCTSQSADSLTFTATTTPSVAIVVNIICL